ncbi:MAG: hypothetical protein SGJ19_07095 [Planctomycetia bacterium]|nr:hypothetical protein [Planctomycetia bacterium]
MRNVQLLSLALFAALAIPSKAPAGVSVDTVGRNIYTDATGLAFGPSDGLFNESASFYINVAGLEGLMEASQNSTIDLAENHFFGTGSVKTETGHWVDSNLILYFTLDEVYNYSFFSDLFVTQGSEPSYAQAVLYSFVDGFGYVPLDARYGTGTTDTSGALAAGQYQLNVFSRLFAAAPPVDASFNFDFKLTEPNNHVVPEPASIAVWACLGLTAGGLKWRRRGKNSNPAA